MKKKKCNHKFEQISSCAPPKCIFCGYISPYEDMNRIKLKVELKHFGITKEQFVTAN